MEQASDKRASERAWGEQIIGERWGMLSEKGEGGGEKRNLVSVARLTQLLTRTCSQFRSFHVLF